MRPFEIGLLDAETRLGGLALAGKTTVFKAFASVHPDGSFAVQVVPVDGNPLKGNSDAFHCNEQSARDESLHGDGL